MLVVCLLGAVGDISNDGGTRGPPTYVVFRIRWFWGGWNVEAINDLFLRYLAQLEVG